MDGPEIIDSFLVRSGLEYEALDDGMWMIHDEHDQVDNILVTWTPPIVLFRVKLMNAPSDAAKRSALFEQLLRLNATDMVSGAYALEGEAIVATETLQVENLDFNEFQAGIDGLTMALTEHYAAAEGSPPTTLRRPDDQLRFENGEPLLLSALLPHFAHSLSSSPVPAASRPRW